MERDLEIWQRACEPADPKAVAVLLEQTLEIFGTPDNWERIAVFYLEAFEDAPLDLVQAALKDVRRTCKFFPKPAELRAPIAKEIGERRHTTWLLRLMLGPKMG